MLEVFYTDLHVYVIMPYMQAGSHADVIKNARLLGKRLSAAMAAHVIKQVLTGIDYLHWYVTT